MTDLLLIIIIIMLGKLIYDLKHSKDPVEKQQKEWKFKTMLPEYKNKNCEIIVKESLAAIDVMFSLQGRLIDFDEEWLMIEIKTKKKTSIKMIRITNISSIKEIIQ